MCSNFDSLGRPLVSFLEYHILFLQMDTKCQICTSPFVQNTLNIKKPLDHHSPKKTRLMNEENLLLKKSPAGEIGAAYTVWILKINVLKSEPLEQFQTGYRVFSLIGVP